MFRGLTWFTLLVLVVASVAGCGGLPPVEGVVTLDGTPVQGATVVFITPDGSGQPVSGVSDATGRFTLSTGGKAGAPPGTYKVVVTKTEAMKGIEGMKPGDPKYMEQMKKGMAKPGPSMPGAFAPKSLLPAIYAKADTTPLTQKVPPDGAIKLELKSK